MKPLFFSLLFSFFFSVSPAQNPQTAKEILANAFSQASKEHKKVFVKFSASWCGWCKKMDASMQDPAVKTYFDDNFVTVHLVVDESKDKLNLETPGADEIRLQYNGDNKQGIPFWLILDDKGTLLADSYMRTKGQLPTEKGENTGCPASNEEVSYFLGILMRTTSLSKEALSIIGERFRENQIKKQ